MNNIVTDPQAIPETLLFDKDSNLIINMAAEAQGTWKWWEDEPDKYERLIELRKEHDIDIEDFVSDDEPEDEEDD